MQTKEEILGIVTTIIAETLGIYNTTKITSESLIVEDLNADSLDQVEILMALEWEFNIEIPTEDAEECKTVKDIVDLIRTFP